MKDTWFDKVIQAGLFMLVVVTLYQIAMLFQSINHAFINVGPVIK